MNLCLKKILGASLPLVMATVALSAQTTMNFGNLPLWFEADGSQVDGAAKYIAHGHDSEFSISSTGAELVLRKSDGRSATVHMIFVGADSKSQIAGESELAGKINHLVGNNPALWRSGVSAYAHVRLKNIYPGVNVVYYGNQQRLEYDLN